MTFSLHGANGETLATVDYSVQDYCIRTLTAITDKPAFSVDIFFAVTHWDVFDEDGEMVPEADVIRAVYAIGKAAAAYHN